MQVEDWFPAARERGNPSCRWPAWSEGSAVTLLVNGAAYFARLADEVRSLQAGDHVSFTDWRGDADERLGDRGPSLGELFGDAARRGVVVKGLMWRSHSDDLAYSEQENRRLGDEVNDAGGEVLLDQRVRRAGSHHRCGPSPATGSSTTPTGGRGGTGCAVDGEQRRNPGRTGGRRWRVGPPGSAAWAPPTLAAGSGPGEGMPAADRRRHRRGRRDHPRVIVPGGPGSGSRHRIPGIPGDRPQSGGSPPCLSRPGATSVNGSTSTSRSPRSSAV